MKIFLVMFGLLVLVGCSDEPTPPTRYIKPPSPNIAEAVTDYGEVEGCSIKWISTRIHPDFWLIKCPDSRNVTTMYETGSKSKTRGIAHIEGN